MKVALTLSVLFFSAQALHASQPLEFETNGMKRLLVKNSSGALTVGRAQGEKATVQVFRNDSSDRCQVKIERQKADLVIEVSSAEFFTSTHCKMDFVVRVPKNTNLNLGVGSGTIKVDGIQGELVTHSGSGTVDANGRFSKVESNTGSGSISVTGVTGEGKVRMGSGTANLSFAEVPKKGALQIAAGSGNATVVFPKGARLRAVHSAMSGELINEIGDTPGAAFEVSMKSGAGNLHIKSF